VSKDVLKCVGELEGIHITKTELNMGVDNQFGEPKDFTTQMEGISET
jgi:hypothetical protein